MAKEDAAKPEFWDKRIREGFMPWDEGGVPRSLATFIESEPPGQRVLIPGCGSGYEVRAFAEAGFEVQAIDYSGAAVELAKESLGALAPLVRLADFFDFDFGAPFDLIYERAFLCALPRRLWPGYAPRMAELLRPGGRIAGYYFFDDNERGPPFGLKSGELESLLAGRFERIADAAVSGSIPIFAARERWQIWRRISNA